MYVPGSSNTSAAVQLLQRRIRNQIRIEMTGIRVFGSRIEALRVAIKLSTHRPAGVAESQ